MAQSSGAGPSPALNRSRSFRFNDLAHSGATLRYMVQGSPRNKRVHRSQENITATRAQRRRLSRFMEERRAQLNRSWTELANRAGISESKFRDIRNNESSVFKVEYAEDIEVCLGWGPGSVISVIGGGDPTIMLSSMRDENEPPRPASDGDIMARWSERLPPNWFWDLYEDIRVLRGNAWTQGRRAVLDDLGIEHDPRDNNPNAAQRTG